MTFSTETFEDGRTLVHARYTIFTMKPDTQCIGWHTPTFVETNVLDAKLWRLYLNSLQRKD